MYELVFWKYSEGIYLNHHLVYEAIAEGQMIDGLEDIPVTIIVNRLQNKFFHWDKVDENSWQNPDGGGAFQIKLTKQSVKIDCYGTQGKQMDVMASVMEEFQCPLYDPQIPFRYDEFND